MVQLAMTFIDKINDKKTKIEFIESLKTVCDKKIFLEVEYARCILQLVKLKESDNSIEEGAKIL